MKTKRLLCLMLSFLISLSSFVAAMAQEAVETVVTTDTSIYGIDYSDKENWAFWNEGNKGLADLFIICPTVDMGRDGSLTANIKTEKFKESFKGALNMELGIYNDVATVYAPYYRQATFGAYSLDEDEREKYLLLAYEDVKDAFLYYAENSDPSKPLILAGFSQGSDMLIRLMKDLFDDPLYSGRLVAAYCIGWKLTEEEIKSFPHLVAATDEDDTGVIITFNTEDPLVTSSLIIGEDEKALAINPLNWKTDSTVADKSENPGACFTDYSGSITEEIPNLTGCYIDEKRGALKVLDISSTDYPGKLFDDGVYHLYDYQFFFRSLQENVKVRLNAYLDKVKVEYDGYKVNFDVEPIIENGRTLVPMRAVFEAMGCAVGYFAENGAMSVQARRGNDLLLLTVGQNKMYFNGEEITLDVPAKIKDGRTLVPLRAITEAFECEVLWNQDTKTAVINSPPADFKIRARQLTETVKADDRTPLIEAVAYYPFIENPHMDPFIEEINLQFKDNAEEFISVAQGYKEEADLLMKEMGSDKFRPFVFEMTFEDTYNTFEILSFTNYSYIYLGGAHPSTVMESFSFDLAGKEELSVSAVIDEDLLEEGLREYIIGLFANELDKMDFTPMEEDMYEYLDESLGYIQFCLSPEGLVLYFNQGEITPYALGAVSVEISYDPRLFLIDMHESLID